MKDSRVSIPQSLITLLVIAFLLLAVAAAKYIYNLNNRYNSLLVNTNKLTDNISDKFGTLESDRVVKHLNKEMYILRQDNLALEREVESLSAQLKNCAKPEVIQRQAVAPKECSRPILKSKKGFWGNRGYLIKDGKSTYSSTCLSSDFSRTSLK